MDEGCYIHLLGRRGDPVPALDTLKERVGFSSSGGERVTSNPSGRVEAAYPLGDQVAVALRLDQMRRAQSRLYQARAPLPPRRPRAQGAHEETTP
jgi:hypothetical protein